MYKDTNWIIYCNPYKTVQGLKESEDGIENLWIIGKDERV